MFDANAITCQKVVTGSSPLADVAACCYQISEAPGKVLKSFVKDLHILNVGVKYFRPTDGPKH